MGFSKITLLMSPAVVTKIIEMDITRRVQSMEIDKQYNQWPYITTDSNLSIVVRNRWKLMIKRVPSIDCDRF